MPAEEKDIPLIFAFVRKLAEYERLSHKVTVNEEGLRTALFGPQRFAEVAFAYSGNEPAGFAVFFHTFSTFSGLAGIYLEDVFVEPAYRKRGIGTALFVYLAQIAKQRGCGRLSWAVLDWNQPAIDFYKRLGAIPLAQWNTYELSGAPLDHLSRKQFQSVD